MEGPSAELMSVFAFWGSILVLKVLAMVPLTARQRFRKKVFANPEDTIGMKSAKTTFEDPDVERVRRAHLNDLENVLPWFIVTYAYLGTNPSYVMASTLIRGFVLSRIAHTITYVILQVQPWRAIAFFIGYLITGYQAIATILHYMS